jgi:hypothetical protein
VRRILVVLLSVGAFATVTAPVATAQPYADIDVTFYSAWSAKIKSTKGISNYVVKLCNGKEYKVELNYETLYKSVYTASGMKSITVKSGLTVETFSRTCAYTY